jgi:hypothetical protein
LNIKCMFLFSLQRFSEKILILRRNERDTIINVYLSSSTRYYCQILMELKFFLKDFRTMLKHQISRKTV